MPVGGLVAWTIFVWIGRIRNAFSDATLSTGEQRGALALALSFVVPAVVIGGALVLAGRSHGRPGAESVVRFGVWALGLWSIGVWLIKAIDIAFLSEQDGAFIVVHTVLAVVSIIISVVAIRAVERRSAASNGHL